jgi:tRNA pseudouridine38-40 synthase
MSDGSGGSRYRITVAYDGTAYAGWQMQPGHPTIQETLQGALHSLCGQDVKIHGSGRTDAGVHARGQVAHFDFPRPFAPASLPRAMNTYLPPDIRVLDAESAAPDFHARRDAAGKEYRYFIWNAPVMLPTARHFHLHVPAPLDAGAMRAAATLLTGKHDFAAFSANPSRIVETTVRTVFSLTVSQADEVIMISASGDGFLYKMVRSIAGWLIRVGQGDVPSARTLEILTSLDRTAAVPTALPQGLFLWKVWYPESSPTQ